MTDAHRRQVSVVLSEKCKRPRPQIEPGAQYHREVFHRVLKQQWRGVFDGSRLRAGVLRRGVQTHRRRRYGSLDRQQ
ncbi:Uncharacterised protein [Mycobacteroides abscessus subsp. abscessus]|nr:Uncharacterised protein [Mycobacteroides abscessus subsp. abscessus]